MWESGLGVALQGTRFCNRAPESTPGGVGDAGGSYKMTDDGKKLTNLESNISPAPLRKGPNSVNCSTFCVHVKPRPLTMIFL